MWRFNRTIIKILFIIFSISLGFVLLNNSSQAATTICTPATGCTGIGSATTTDIGKVLTVSSSNPFTYTLSTPSASSGGGADQRVNTSTANYFTYYGSATAVTGTPLMQLTAGTITFSSTTNFSNISATSVTSTNLYVSSTTNLANALIVEASSSITYINSLQTGPINFPADAGLISWVNMPLVSTTPAGVVNGYIARIGSQNILTVYSESNGVGGAQNLRVGVRTTTPRATLAVEGDFLVNGGATSTDLAIKNKTSCNASNQALQTDSSGNVNCGTLASGGGGSGAVNTSTQNYFTYYLTGTSVTGTPLMQLTAGTITFSSTTVHTNISVTSVTSTNLNISSLANIFKLGINTSSPTAQLAIQGNDGTNPFEITSSTGTSLFRVLTNGNVGINSSSPGYTLGVQGFISGTRVYTGNPNVYLGSDSGGIVVTGGYLYANGNSNSFYAQNKAVFRGGLSNDSAPYMTILGGTSSSTYFNGTVGINTTTPQNKLTIQGDGSNPFSVVTNTAAAPSMFIILTNGMVGINTNTPQAMLGVEGSLLVNGSVTSTNLYISASSTFRTSTIAGGFFQSDFTDCSAENQTVNYNATTGKFLCLTDGGGAGSVSINGVASTSFNFTTSSDDNIGIAITTSTDSVTFNPYFKGVLPIARGGTNSSSISSAGSVIYSDGSKYNATQVGTLGYMMLSGGAGNAPYFVSTSGLCAVTSSVGEVVQGTLGQIPYYAGTTTTLSPTSSVFLSTGGLVGVGTTTFAIVDAAKLTIDAGATNSREGLYIQGSIDDFFESNVRNLSTGTSAQSCTTVTGALGSLTSGFASLCMNSPNFSSSTMFNIGGGNDSNLMFNTQGNGYLALVSATGSLYLSVGNTTSLRGIKFSISSNASNGFISAYQYPINQPTNTQRIILTDPDIIPSITAAGAVAIYSDDTSRMIQVVTATASSNLQLRNGSFANAVQLYSGTISQTATNVILCGTGCKLQGAVTSQGYHYVFIASSTRNTGGLVGSVIKRATSSPSIDLNQNSSWPTTTVSGIYPTSTANLVGFSTLNGQPTLWFQSSTTQIVPYTINTSTNSLTQGTTVTITGANMSILATRVNENGIYAQFSSSPFMRKYTHAGVKVAGVSDALVAVPANGPDVFATPYSIYALAGGSTTNLTRLIGY